MERLRCPNRHPAVAGGPQQALLVGRVVERGQQLERKARIGVVILAVKGNK